jgi:hypothetical protein
MKRLVGYVLVFLSIGLFAQPGSVETQINNSKLTIKVGELIDEQTVFLLRQELKASSDILEYININHRDSVVYIKALKPDINLYTSIFDSYFDKYKIIKKEEIIYSKPQE